MGVQRGTQAGCGTNVPAAGWGDPHFAHHCRVVAGAGPFVVFGDACPACSVPSGSTPEIVRNKRIPLLVPRPAQNRSRSW